MPQTLDQPFHSELLIRKSRFIGCIQPVADRSSAQKVVDELWQFHPGATHICWALLAGGQSAAVDDGEPSGTAGRPMLEVLRHHDLEGVLATVVRYFGGVKLGAGGLVRAYTDTIAQAVQKAHKVPLVTLCEVCCGVDYALEGRVRYMLEQEGIALLDVIHDERVHLRFCVPLDKEESFRSQFAALTQGQLLWSKCS